MDNTLDVICDMMYCELDEITKKEKLDSKDVELIDKFVDIIKDIYQIETSQGEIDASRMDASHYTKGSSYRNMPTYGRNYMGRMRSGNDGYSRAESKTMMLDHLQEVMDMAVDEKDRKAVERLMQQMEQN